jgi:hypothetical protein
MPYVRRDVDATADSYPYVTGMGFRNRAHLIFDEFHREGPDAISQDNQVVFVKIDYIPHFFTYIMPNIKNKVKIVTHNGDIGVDSRYKQLLDHSNVTVWYAQNANFVHKKLNSIPLGLCNKRWVHGNTKDLEDINKENIDREHLLYMNFDVNTNKSERTKVFELFVDRDYVFSANKKPFKGYLRDLRANKYALSPPGAGIDCHRIWESICVGTIPIVERCHNISFYEHLPILIIDDWNSITKDLLEKRYEGFVTAGWDNSYMFMDHWINEIGLLKDPRYIPAGIVVPPGCSLQTEG